MDDIKTSPNGQTPADGTADNKTPTSLVSEPYWEGLYQKQAGFEGSASLNSVLNKRLTYYQLDKLFRLFFPVGPGCRFLEFGCGGSFWLPYFYSRMRYEVEGVDYSPTGCDQARAQLKRFSSEGRVHCRDFLTLAGQFDDRFDVCASFGVVEHFERPADLISRFTRCLKRGGFLVTTIPCLKGFQGMMQKFVNAEIYHHHQILTVDDLARMHVAAGLAVRYAGGLGLTTLGRNFGSGLLGKLYAKYNAVMNRVAVRLEKACRKSTPVLRGSGSVVIAQRT